MLRGVEPMLPLSVLSADAGAVVVWADAVAVVVWALSSRVLLLLFL